MEAYLVLLERIKIHLKSKGFTSKGSTFYIKKDGNWGLISFQKSRSSSSDAMSFTINLGVTSEKLRSFQSSTLSKPHLDDCHWKIRIGELLAIGEDYWWTLDRDTAVDKLCREILGILDEKAIPEIYNNITDEKLENAWFKGISKGITEFERLMNLTAILKLYNKPSTQEAAMALKVFSIDKPFEDVADDHLRKLKIEL
jgi:hypothetical protein